MSLALPPVRAAAPPPSVEKLEEIDSDCYTTVHPPSTRSALDMVIRRLPGLPEDLNLLTAHWFGHKSNLG